MYSVRVEAKESSAGVLRLDSLQEFPVLAGGDAQAARTPPPPASLPGAGEQLQPETERQPDGAEKNDPFDACDDGLDGDLFQDALEPSLEFTAGNPRVQHLTGVVHLYREIPPAPAPTATAAGPGPSTSAALPLSSPATLQPPPPSRLPEERQPLLCCLAIPADMALADFCRWCAAYLPTIRSMRVLRREARSRVVCMVLLRFAEQQHADAFFEDCHMKPFSTLEPEIMCRLVWVRQVQILNPGSHAPHTTDAVVASRSSGGLTSLMTERSGSTGAITAGAALGRGGGAARPTTPSVSQRPSMQHPAAAAASGSPPTGAAPPPGTELPTCPVCLERLDEYISGVVTTVCNHQFHSDCLLKWGDTSCPVCRYCTQAHASTSHCATCNASHDLWICLICGHVGCGRYRAGHAHNHWRASNHCYALELESQRVWDYAGDNYVHRLIQSKTDGKLVEVPTPADSRRRRSRAGRRSGGGRGGRGGRGRLSGVGDEGGSHDEHDGEGGTSDWSSTPDDDEIKQAMLASKLDHIAAEYNHLLASQLDSQRQYFEGLLAQQAASLKQAVAAAEMDAAAKQAALVAAGAAQRESDRKRQALEKKLADVTAQQARTTEERGFLQSLNDNLIANQKELRKQLDACKTELASRDAAIVDLQEQVRDLMVYIEAERVAASSEELRDATVMAAPAAPTAGRGRGRGRGRSRA